MSKYHGNLVHVAEAVRSHGRGGDDVLVHVNPDEFRQMQQAWGEHSVNPHTGLPEYGLFSKLKKALKFESFNVKGIVKDIAKNPQRLLTGAVDPIGTKLTNKVFGTNYDPAVNQLGGATKKRFADAEAKGMDTGLAQDLHKTAAVIAAFYAAGGASGLGGAGGATGGGLDAVGSGAYANGALADAGFGGLGSAGAAGAGAGAGGAGLSGLADVSTSALSNYQLPASVTSSLGDAASAGGGLSGLASKAGSYAKDVKNWPTIAKGVTALGGLAGAGAAGHPGAPSAQDPGTPLNVQYPGRQFQDGDYSKYYNYGEGPEHSYYTLGPQPEQVWNDDPNAGGVGLAMGGQPRLHHSGLGAPLSNESRYMQDGPGSGRGDEIDAKLSPKEYVMDAETVALLGDGNPDHGAKKLDAMRKKIRMHKGKKLAKGQFSAKAKNPEGYL